MTKVIIYEHNVLQSFHPQLYNYMGHYIILIKRSIITVEVRRQETSSTRGQRYLLKSRKIELFIQLKNYMSGKSTVQII